jgi:hypothetical protein
MAINATSRRIAEFCRFGMTAAALHGPVCVSQCKLGRAVIERFAVELDDIGISSLVVGVTMGAILPRCIRLATVKPFASNEISSNFFVAFQT